MLRQLKSLIKRFQTDLKYRVEGESQKQHDRPKAGVLEDPVGHMAMVVVSIMGVVGLAGHPCHGTLTMVMVVMGSVLVDV